MNLNWTKLKPVSLFVTASKGNFYVTAIPSPIGPMTISKLSDSNKKIYETIGIEPTTSLPHDTWRNYLGITSAQPSFTIFFVLLPAFYLLTSSASPRWAPTRRPPSSSASWTTSSGGSTTSAPSADAKKSPPSATATTAFQVGSGAHIIKLF